MRRKAWVMLFVSLILEASSDARTVTPAPANVRQRVEALLQRTPLIDGHNDWAWALYEGHGDRAAMVDLRRDASRAEPPLDTDILRLRAGHVGGQFWSAWIPSELTGGDAVRATLAQIDRIRTIVARYPDTFEFAETASDIRRIHRAGRIASLIGVEGGDQLGGSLAVLRIYRALGARYLTLTHARTTAWADSATDTPRHGGLTAFGRDVVRELNRLGMMVDLSHVSPATMADALACTRAPVIFSHSGARGAVDHPRNVPDEILAKLPANGGIVMVAFVNGYVSEAHRQWAADRAAEEARISAQPYGGLFVGQPDRVRSAMAAWDSAHPRPTVSISAVADHIDHIRKIAGIDHVGLGSDFDGTRYLPNGLEGVDGFPALLAELARRGWSDGDLAKLSGENALRVMTRVEEVARSMENESPAQASLPDAAPERAFH